MHSVSGFLRSEVRTSESRLRAYRLLRVLVSGNSQPLSRSITLLPWQVTLRCNQHAQYRSAGQAFCKSPRFVNAKSDKFHYLLRQVLLSKAPIYTLFRSARLPYLHFHNQSANTQCEHSSVNSWCLAQRINFLQISNSLLELA